MNISANYYSSAGAGSNLQRRRHPRTAAEDNMDLMESFNKNTGANRNSINRRFLSTCDTGFEAKHNEQNLDTYPFINEVAALQREKNAASASDYQTSFVPAMYSRACTMDDNDLIRLLNEPVVQEDGLGLQHHREQHIALGLQQKQHQKDQQQQYRQNERPQQQQQLQQSQEQFDEVIPAPPILASCESTSSNFGLGFEYSSWGNEACKMAPPTEPLRSIVSEFLDHDQSKEFVSNQGVQLLNPVSNHDRLGMIGPYMIEEKPQIRIPELQQQELRRRSEQKLIQDCYLKECFAGVPVLELLNNRSSKSNNIGGSETNCATQGTKRLHDFQQEDDLQKRPRYTPPSAIRFFEVTDRDVLFGRGPSVYGHPGNITLHDEKLKVQPLYLKMGKAEKKKISQQLVDRIHELGGRFLQQEPANELWYEVTNRQAREKAAQVLREVFTPEMRRQKRQRYKQSSNNSSTN